jgi:hypothetical protein
MATTPPHETRETMVITQQNRVFPQGVLEATRAAASARPGGWACVRRAHYRRRGADAHLGCQRSPRPGTLRGLLGSRASATNATTRRCSRWRAQTSRYSTNARPVRRNRHARPAQGVQIPCGLRGDESHAVSRAVQREPTRARACDASGAQGERSAEGGSRVRGGRCACVRTFRVHGRADG